MIKWVASYPKSGNTWVRLFLMAYEWPKEFHADHRLKWHLSDVESRYYDAVAPAPLSELNQDEFLALRGAVLVHMLHDVPEPSRLVVKTHSVNSWVRYQTMIPPHLTDRAVYLVRDPRDVAVSYSDHLGWDIDKTIAFMAWDDAVLEDDHVYQTTASWSVNVRTWQQATYPILQVRYEDLLTDPVRQFANILEFMGFELEEERFVEALELTTFDALRKQEDKEGVKYRSAHQERFFRQGKSGKWKDVLTSEQARAIEKKHYEVMQHCGYLT